MTVPTLTSTRESWLMQAVEILRPRFDEVGLPLPESVRVSVGFGIRGTAAESKNILGATWSRAATEDGVNAVFISPEVDDTAQVLAILLHELIHAADDNKSGHRKAFAEAAVRFGFEGSLLEVHPSIALAAEFMVIAAELGEYPHSRLTVQEPAKVPVGTDGITISGPRWHSGPAKQGTRLIKVICPCCGYTLRTTAKWLAVGFPSCPSGTVMDLG